MNEKKDAKRWEKHSYEFGFYFWIYIYTRLLCIRLGCRLNVLLFFISFHYLPSAHCCCRWIKNVICSLFVSPVVRFKRASIPYTLWNCQYYGVTKATLWLTVINTCLHVCTCNVCVYNFRFVISVYVIPILFVVFLFFFVCCWFELYLLRGYHQPLSFNWWIMDFDFGYHSRTRLSFSISGVNFYYKKTRFYWFAFAENILERATKNKNERRWNRKT